MRRISLWVLSTLSVLVLLFGYSTSTAGPLAAGAASSAESGPTAGSGTTSGSTSGSTASGSTGSTGSGSTDAGSTGAGSSGSSGSTTVAGSVAQTQWGPVQVQISVADGKVTQVDVLQQPSGNPKDEEINAYALPILTQETIDAQSAQIDMVSGATVTSDGYVQSLQSALDQAGL